MVCNNCSSRPESVPECIDPVFAKTVIENERFGLVFAKTGSINTGTGTYRIMMASRLTKAVISNMVE
jgi:hypothetical protein